MNGTTGAFAVTMQIGSPAAGAVAVVLQGGVQTVVMDGTNVYVVTSGSPTGKIDIFPMSVAPAGWLECDGSAISRTAYPALNNIAAIAGYAAPWGPGDGSTTFNIPDLRAYFIRGWDHGAGRDPSRAFGSTQTSANLSHTHGITDPGHVHTLTLTSGGGNAYTPSGTPARWSNDSALGASPTATVASHTTGVSVNSSGGGEARPINVALLYAIKT
jgi:microcystin-dependent protein